MEKVKVTTGGQKPVAMVWGITGQDGSYLAEYLLSKGYYVVGVGRRSSVNTKERLAGVENQDDFYYREGDITDATSVSGLINEYKPHECYNLAAQSHVGTSFQQPVSTFQIDAVGPLNLLDSIRTLSPDTRYYQASTSELFGDNTSSDDDIYKTFYTADGRRGRVLVGKGRERYQGENTAFAPRSPYAVAKMAAHHLVHTYRESYGLHASSGILFNHESPRRGENFVTRKITKWIGQFVNEYGPFPFVASLPVEKQLALGNLDAYRDWGYAGDYVRAMHLMLQQSKPDDYVIATGEAHSVREFLDETFNCIGIADWTPYVRIDPKFFRPAEVEYLRGRADKAQRVLGWKPEVTFKELVKKMVENDIQMAKSPKTVYTS